MGERRIFLKVWQNFVASLMPRAQPTKSGILKGTDHFGNMYYEVPAVPSKGKRFPKRWFVPPVEMQIDTDRMPPEWDCWLRLKRNEAPTTEELQSNLAIAAMKALNAKKINEKAALDRTSIDKIEEEKHINMTKFPMYDDLEVLPGEGYYSDNKKKRNK